MTLTFYLEGQGNILFPVIDYMGDYKFFTEEDIDLHVDIQTKWKTI